MEAKESPVLLRKQNCSWIAGMTTFQFFWRKSPVIRAQYISVAASASLFSFRWFIIFSEYYGEIVGELRRAEHPSLPRQILVCCSLGLRLLLLGQLIRNTEDSEKHNSFRSQPVPSVTNTQQLWGNVANCNVAPWGMDQERERATEQWPDQQQERSRSWGLCTPFSTDFSEH